MTTEAPGSTTTQQSWQVGNVRITKIVEVEMHWRFGALFPDVTPEMVAALPWLTPDFVDTDGKMILSVHALVVESEGKRIMVDTCIGNDKERPVRSFDRLSTDFTARLTAAGFPPESIDTVFCTHLHADHVGWNTSLVDGRWVPTFPNARHLFTGVELEHWRTDPDADSLGPVMADSVEPIVAAGLADIVGLDHAITSEVRLLSTPGHTPGHCSVHISSGGEDAFITGDMIHNPLQIVHGDLRCAVDVDGDLGVRTRTAFVERHRNGPALIIGTHFAGPTAGRIVADGDGWRFSA
jgi:glyoxylase-like metal-dependent hydrolase (beta-lactamase superfamily II)